MANPGGAAPSGRQGWFVVGGLAVVSFVTLGASMPTIGVFLEPLAAEFGWTAAESSRIATAFMMAFQMSAPVVGWLLERFAVKTVLAAGVTLVVLGYAAASFATGLTQLTLAMGVAGLGVSASTYIPAMVLAARWIGPDRRAFAIGLIIGASSLGGAFFVPVAQYLIDVAGWQVAKQSIALAALITALPIVLFVVRERPAQPLFEADFPAADVNSGVAAALRAPSFLWLVSMIILANVALMGVIFHVVPFLTDANFATHTAATLYAGTNISSFVGYILVGLLADRIGAHRALLASLMLNAVSIWVLTTAAEGGLWPALVFVIVWGATIGASGQLLPVLLLESLGPRRLSTLLGFAGLFSGTVGAIGPMMTGALHDRSGSYVPAFELCALLTLLALIPTVLARRRRLRCAVSSG